MYTNPTNVFSGHLRVTVCLLPARTARGVTGGEGGGAPGGGAADTTVTPQTMSNEESRDGHEGVTSWLEGVGRHLVGAGVVHVMPRLMRAVRAFMRAWSEDNDDEVEV